MRWRYWWVIWAALAVAIFVGGVSQGQLGRVKIWADTLCTGCIGLTPPRESSR